MPFAQPLDVFGGGAGALLNAAMSAIGGGVRMPCRIGVSAALKQPQKRQV
jgi:hypothetical protein